MSMTEDSGYSRKVGRQYRELMKHCKANLDKAQAELPPAREDFYASLKERGISRRGFIKWTSFMTAALMLPPVFRPIVARAAETFSLVPVVSLLFAEGTVCS